MSLTIVAQIEAKPGTVAELAESLRSLIPLTRAEPGCEAYEMHRSITDDRLFHFHEVWTDRSAWEAHMAAEHMTAFGARKDDLVADWRLFELERVA
ncbi:MAG: putative quinol monooxygenase [Pseudomonadota bacterium]